MARSWRTWGARGGWSCGWLCLAAVVLSAPAGGETPAEATRPLSDVEMEPAAAPPKPAALQALIDARRDLDAGEANDALRTLHRAIDDFTEPSAELYYLMARGKAAIGKVNEARLLADAAAALDPDAPDVNYLLGVLHQQRGDVRRACAHFQHAAAAADAWPNNPHVTSAWFRLGMCLTELGYWRAAAEAYGQFDEIVWVSHPEHRDVPEVANIVEDYPDGLLEERVRLLRQAGMTDEILAIARAEYELRPREASVAALYVQALSRAGRTDMALQICRPRLHNPQTMPTFVPLAVEAAIAGDALPALCDEVAAEVGTSAEAVGLALTLAEALAQRERLAAAMPLWSAVHAKLPARPDAAWQLATAQLRDARFEAAVDTLAALLEVEPAHALIPEIVLRTWARGEFDASGVDALLERIDDARSGRQTAVAAVALATGRAAQGAELLAQAQAADPNVALAHTLLMQLATARYDWQTVLAEAEAAKARRPDLAAVAYLEGVALDGLDRNEAAELAFKRAQRMAPDNVSYALALAEHYRRLNDLSAAQRFAQQALSADPTHPEALETAIELYLAGGKSEVARAQYERVRDEPLPADVRRRIVTGLRFADQPVSPAYAAVVRRQFREAPHDAKTGLRLAAALFYRTRDYDEAHDVIQRVAALQPDDVQTLVLLAESHAQQLNFDEAIAVYEQLHERYPNRVALIAGLARAYGDGFEIEQERALLHGQLAKVDSDGRRLAWRAQLLESYVLFGDFELALTLLDDWLAEQDELPPAWIVQQRLRVLVAAERFDQAVSDATAYLAEQSDDEDRREAFAQTLYSAKRYAALEAELLKWRQAEPSALKWVEWLVEVQLADERPGDALALVRTFDPVTFDDNMATQRLRARCEAETGAVEAAVEQLRGLLSTPLMGRSPRQLDLTRQQLVLILVEDRQFDRALELCQQWLARVSDDDAAQRRHLWELQRLVTQSSGEIEPYAEVMLKLLADQPEDPGLNNDLGYFWIDADLELERATDMVRRAVAQRPRVAAYLDSLGWAYYKAGDFAAALVYLERSTQLYEGQDAIVYDHLGDCAYRLGRSDAAATAWRQALALAEAAEEDLVIDHAALAQAISAKLMALDAGDRVKVAPLAPSQGNAGEHVD